MEDYLREFPKCSSYAQKQQVLSRVIAKENEMRQLFAQDRNNPILNNQNLMMIPIHAVATQNDSQETQ